MSNVGQRERETQKRVVQFFQDELKYDYLGDWQGRENNRNVEEALLRKWLQGRGVSEVLIGRALRQLDTAAALGEGKNFMILIRPFIAFCVMALKIKKVLVSRIRRFG